MKIVTLCPNLRFDADSIPSESLFPKSPRAPWAVFFLFVMFLAAGLTAILRQDLQFRFSLGSLTLLGVSSLLLGIHTVRLRRLGIVRLKLRRGATQVTAPPWMLGLWMLLYAATALLVLVWWWLFNQVGSGGLFRSGNILLPIGLTGCTGLVVEGPKLLFPSGLTLTSTGISGVRGAQKLMLDWNQLERVHVVTGKRGARLIFTTITSATPIDIASRLLASDPRVVAQVIEFYRTNPQLRTELDHPEQVVQRIRTAEL